MAEAKNNRNYRGRRNTNRNRVSTRTQKLKVITENDIKEVKEAIPKQPKTIVKEVVKEVKVIDDEKLKKLSNENRELKEKLIKESEAKEFLTKISEKVNNENALENKRQRALNLGISIVAFGMLILVVTTYLNDLLNGLPTFINNILVIISVTVEAFGLVGIIKTLLRK